MKRLLLAATLVVAACSQAATPPPAAPTAGSSSDKPILVYRDLVNKATCWYIYDNIGSGNHTAISCVADSVLHP